MEKIAVILFAVVFTFIIVCSIWAAVIWLRSEIVLYESNTTQTIYSE